MKKKARRSRSYAIRCVLTAVCVVGLVISAGVILKDIATTQHRAQTQQKIADLMPEHESTKIDENAPYDPSAAKQDVVVAVVPEDSTPAQTDVVVASVPDESTPAETDVVVASVPETEENNTTALAASIFNTSTTAKADEVYVHPDFQKLYDINPDLVGKLDMGTTISEVIVQRDNEFYLNHDFYGNEDNAGTLFANEANTLFPEPDQNILLHGHNMRDGSSLGTMDNFRDAKWLKNNPIFYLRLINEDAAHVYVPIAFFDASVSMGDPNFFDVHINFDQERFDKYIGDAKARSIYNIPVDVNINDQLLTVMTCSYVYNNSRFIMVARELREGETIADMKALVQSAAQ